MSRWKRGSSMRANGTLSTTRALPAGTSHRCTMTPLAKSWSFYSMAQWHVNMPAPRAFDETWEWDGIAWRKGDPLVPQREVVTASAAAYDAGRGRWVRFGGATDPFGVRRPSGETWEYGSFERIRLEQPSDPRGRTASVGLDRRRAAISSQMVPVVAGW